MHQKVRSRLTILFSTVTCSLLLIFLAVCFFLSARSQLSIQLANFTRQAVSAAQEAGSQNVLTTEWLSDKEIAGSFYLFLLDQNTPVFHNSRQPEALQTLFEEIRPYFMPGSSTPLPDSLKLISEDYEIYQLRRGLIPGYFIYLDTQVKNSSILQIFALQPLQPLYESLLPELTMYLLLFLFAGTILILFCWHFTGTLLLPLERARISQNRFIANASHELRTPLAVILANAAACKKADHEAQEPFFAVIEREGEQMSVLLEQLLTLSRADSQALTLQIEETDLQTMLLEVYEAFYPLAVRENHHLGIHLPEDELPVCRCDSFRIEQALSILIRNALSYTPEGCQIRIALSCTSQWIDFSVSDDGPGIPDAEKERIFERFYRVETMHSQKGHHGLGLSVAREIALAHKGALTVKDSKMGGAEFVLRIPVR